MLAVHIVHTNTRARALGVVGSGCAHALVAVLLTLFGRFTRRTQIQCETVSHVYARKCPQAGSALYQCQFAGVPGVASHNQAFTFRQFVVAEQERLTTLFV